MVLRSLSSQLICTSLHAHCRLQCYSFLLSHCVARFLPPCCDKHVAVKLLGGEGGASKRPALKKSDEELDLAEWLMAWEGYSLCAAILDQMTFESTMYHKMQVGL